MCNYASYSSFAADLYWCLLFRSSGRLFQRSQRLEDCVRRRSLAAQARQLRAANGDAGGGTFSSRAREVEKDLGFPETCAMRESDQSLFDDVCKHIRQACLLVRRAPCWIGTNGRRCPPPTPNTVPSRRRFSPACSTSAGPTRRSSARWRRLTAGPLSADSDSETAVIDPPHQAAG